MATTIYLEFPPESEASDLQPTEETDVDSSPTASTSDSSNASGAQTFVDFDEGMVSSGLISVYSDDNPLVSVGSAEDVAATVYDSEVPQSVSESDSESHDLVYQTESEDVASSSEYDTSSSRPDTRDSVVVLTCSPRVNTADYPESVASMGSPYELICGREQDSLPSYSAAVTNGYAVDPQPRLSPSPPQNLAALSLRAELPTGDTDLDFPLGRLSLAGEAIVSSEERPLSSSHGTSSSFSDSTCSSSECYASESDDSSDSDEDDEEGSHSDDTDGDESHDRGDSESDASQGPSYNFEDSIDGNTSGEEDDSDGSNSEANSDDKFRILLSTIANAGPEDLFPIGGESGYSSSGSSAYDNSYRYHSDDQKAVGVASRPLSSSYDFYDQMSFISSEVPHSLDTNMREKLGITVGQINVVDHSNSSEERLDSSLSQFNETGSRGSALGSLHLGRDLWSELSRSPLPPKSPPSLLVEPLSPVPVQKKFLWKIPPAAPFPKPRLTFDEPVLKKFVEPQEVVMAPMLVDVKPPFPFPPAPALSVAFTEASDERSFDYFPSTIVSCEDARLDDTLNLGAMPSRRRVSRRISFTHTRLRLDVWNSMADVLCGHDLPGGYFPEEGDIEQMEKQGISAFLSDPVDSDHLGLSTSSVEVDERDLEASDLDKDLMLRLRRYSMVDTGIEVQHTTEVVVSPHSLYAPASSTFFSSDYNSSSLTPTPDTSPQDFLSTDDDVSKIPLMCGTAANSSEGSAHLPASGSVPGDSGPDVSPKSLESFTLEMAQVDVAATSSALPEATRAVVPVSSSCSDSVELTSGSGIASDSCSSNLPSTSGVSAPLSTSTGADGSIGISSSDYYTSTADASDSLALSSSVPLSSSNANSCGLDSKPKRSPLMRSSPLLRSSPLPVCGGTPVISPKLRKISLYSPPMLSPESDVDARAKEPQEVASEAAPVENLALASNTSKCPAAISLASPAPFPSRRVASPGVVSIVPYQLPTVPFVPSTEGRREIAAMATNLQSELSSYFDTPKKIKGKMVLIDVPPGVLGQSTSATSNVTDENVPGSAGANIVDDLPNPDSGSASTRGSRRSRTLRSDGEGSPRLLVSLKERVKRSFKSESKLRKNELDDLADAVAGLGYRSPAWKSPSWKSPSFKSPSWKSPSHHHSGDTMKRHTISNFFSRSRDATLRD